MLSQIAVAVAPLIEGHQGAATAAHVERGGTSTHYAHNDATCVSCQARSLLGLNSRAPRVAADRVTAVAPIVAAEVAVTAQRFSPVSPRAPPIEL